MTERPHELVDARPIIERCRELGFTSAGVCAAESTDHRDEFEAWLRAGKHGSMAYLEDLAAERCDPQRVLSGARTMILVADQYASRNGSHEDDTQAPAAPAFGRIARYARGRDYHRVIKRRLMALADWLREQHPDAEFRVFTDTAPVMEREHALRAGLGWIGRHTLLIHPRRGSYFFIGGILTTLPLKQPSSQRRVADHCGTCTRCVEACPTDAIGDYTVDASRCISYLTIERRLPIDPEFHEAMGDWIFGCDICQEVCPHNSPRRRLDPRPNPEYAPKQTGFDLLEVLGWTEDDRRAAFEASALKRARLDMMKRNAVIAAGNVLCTRNDEALRRRIRELAADETEPALVRDTARDVLGRLGRD